MNYIHMSICFIFIHFYVKEFYLDCYLFLYFQLFFILFSNLLTLYFLTDDQHIFIYFLLDISSYFPFIIHLYLLQLSIAYVATIFGYTDTKIYLKFGTPNIKFLVSSICVYERERDMK